MLAMLNAQSLTIYRNCFDEVISIIAIQYWHENIIFTLIHLDSSHRHNNEQYSPHPIHSPMP